MVVRGSEELAVAVAAMGAQERASVLDLLKLIKNCSEQGNPATLRRLEHAYTQAAPRVLAAVAQVALALPWR